MHTRSVVAAATGVAGAALARVLDVAGQLPLVHESADVRHGLGPVATVVWLAASAALAAVSARRPLWSGAAAVVVAALPELVARHDPGAVVEPAALAGALMQWTLLLLVIAVAVAVQARLSSTPFRRPAVVAPRDRVTPAATRTRVFVVARTSLSRAPPRRSLLTSP
jgi:hypothetical protein